MQVNETYMTELGSALENIRALLERRTTQGYKTSLPALEIVSLRFGLSEFEETILMLCAGMELDSSFADLCAAPQGGQVHPYPTFNLAMKVLPSPHWSALVPAAPLRKWGLIDIFVEPGVPLTSSRLKIEERILHFLCGIEYLDERLAPLVRPLQAAGPLVPSHDLLARTIGLTWERVSEAAPVVNLFGSSTENRRTIAAATCSEAGLKAYVLLAEHVPLNSVELESLLRLWQRESLLSSAVLVIDA